MTDREIPIRWLTNWSTWMKNGLIPTIQKEWFGQTILKNIPFQHPLCLPLNRLLYATLEVPKVLSPIFSSFVEKSFLNHTLIIMTTWIEMFSKTGWKHFIEKLTAKLTVLMVMDNAKYHSRLSEKTPTINMKKIYDFIYEKTSYWNSSPLPVKPMLLEKIREANIPKKYVIDEMATAAGYSPLYLSSYHCAFNPTEMV